MKFTKIYMKNFMRYKGENSIEFSTDPVKNVTVILGDNTRGKTTIAQAFRWCLYGEIIDTKYDVSKKISILNNEVLGDLEANDIGEVVVELTIEDIISDEEIVQKRIVRRATYKRKYPKYTVEKNTETLKIYEKDNKTGSDKNIGDSLKDKRMVDDMINELLPKNLSTYFLFDGERWSDGNKSRDDIKNSIYNIVGISPVREMKRHLGEFGTYGRAAVIKTLESKKTGSGDEYEEIIKKIDDYSNRIENAEKIIKEAKDNIDYYKMKISEKEEWLNSNPNIENDQKDYNNIIKDIQNTNEMIKMYNSDIVNKFSLSFKYFATPMLKEIITMIEGIDLSGVDIPGIIDKTILYIIKNGVCICGNKVVEGSEEIKCLNNLLKIVPPAKIGGIVKKFKDKLNGWSYEASELYSSIINAADMQNSYKKELYDLESSKDKLEKKIDRKVNFENERKMLNDLIKVKNDNLDKHRIEENNVKDYKIKITELERRKKFLDEKNVVNEKLNTYIEYAKELYRRACNSFEKDEKKVLSDLNSIVEINYREMFNDQDKIAKLTDEYELQLLYKRISNSNSYSELEATGLSEGEKIARNFAFITSILELSNKQKNDGNEVAQSFPLVLDAPFSKLSSINISKVAKVLPKVSEQIIIFMLDKDWQHSGLKQYTNDDYIYNTIKEIDGNSSEIRKGMVL